MSAPVVFFDIAGPEDSKIKERSIQMCLDGNWTH